MQGFEEGPNWACLETGGERHGHRSGRWDVDPLGGGLPGPWVQEPWYGLRPSSWSGWPATAQDFGWGQPVGKLSAPNCRCDFDVAQTSGQRTPELPTAAHCISATQFSRRLQEMRDGGRAITLWTEWLAGNQGAAFQPQIKRSFHPDAYQCAHTPFSTLWEVLPVCGAGLQTSPTFFPISSLPQGEEHTAEMSVRAGLRAKGRAYVISAGSNYPSFFCRTRVL